MSKIQTVLGQISPDALGHCQMHEHLFVSAGPGTDVYPALLADSVEKSAAEAKLFREAGGTTIVDCQPVGAGRDAAALKEISRLSGVNIIAVTGFHLPFFYRVDDPLLSMGEEELYSLYIDELENGCREDRSVLPGVVKSALGKEGCEGMTEIRYRAACRAAAKAEVPLIVHTEKGAGGVKAVRIAQEAGLLLNRILICHVDRQAANFAPHDEIAATGAKLEYDTIGRFKYHDDASEVELIRHMAETGHAAQILCSLDTTSQRMAAYGGSIALDYILRIFLNELREAGLAEELIQQIIMRNPASVFC